MGKIRKMIVQIEIRNGKTIDDFVEFNNNFISTHTLKTIRGFRTQKGVKYELYHGWIAEKYIKELRKKRFKVTVT